MRQALILLLSFWLPVSLIAQNVTGIIKDENSKPVNGSTVSLLRSKDSVSIKYTATKEDGKFFFTKIDKGNYIISASHVGYKPIYSSSFSVEGTDKNLADLIMNKITGDLKGVTVTSEKPMVEVRADKTILNVEGTINAVGSDALELLRKSPGVTVDKDDNISLSGKNGVQVYIDGRPTPLSGKDLSEYLKSMQSAQIEALEIITNPSAKYEAAGNAGIINIRLKKNKSFGTNGSVNAGWNIGTYAKYNTGLALNHRNKTVNVFGNYNYNHGNNANAFNLYRLSYDTLFDGHTTMLSRNNNHGFKAGMDYFIGRKSTIGLIVNGNIVDNNFNSKGNTPISYNPSNTFVHDLRATSNNLMERNNTSFNANYRYADTSGTELNIDGDHGRYRINSNQMQSNFYFNSSNTETKRAIYNMIAPTDIGIYSVKGDYEQNFKKGKLGIGGKIAFVNTNNDFQRYDVYASSKALDKERSNIFDYEENINAAYVNYNKGLKGMMVQAGVRVENTTSKGHSTGLKNTNGGFVPYDSSFKRQYTDFFPSAAVTFNKNPMSQVGLTYSRRIDRPAYQDLNPFEFKLDDYTFMKGNINLRPQYTNSFGVTHSYKYKLNTRLNYSHVKDMFAQLPDTVNKSAAFMSKRNLATQDVVSLNVSYPFQYKSFSSFANLNANYSHYQADFGTGRKIDEAVPAFNFFAQNSLRFAKTWTAEISGFYSSPTVWQGTFKSKSMWGVDGGLQKQVLKGKGNIKAAVSDIFHTMKWSGSTRFAGQYAVASGNWESRLFKLNFSYRFGSNEVKAARQRNSGAEEESKRVQSGDNNGIRQ
jgi:hypothetical protein